MALLRAMQFIGGCFFFFFFFLISGAATVDGAAIRGPRADALDVLDLVDVFIGTGGEGYGCGSLWPGASVPFGNVRLSPDTAPSVGAWLPPWHFGGYHHDDDLIRGFTHNHMVGSGVVDLGLVSVMPVVDRPWPVPEHFSHDADKENGSPGYYRVVLGKDAVQVELTASHLVGFHRYTFLAPAEDRSDNNNNNNKWISISASKTLHPHACQLASINFNQSQSPQSLQDGAGGLVTGLVRNNGGYSGGGFFVYFAARFSEPPLQFGSYENASTFSPGRTSSSGCGEQGLSFSFDSPQVELAVAISYISVEQALLNLQQEQAQLGSLQFEAALERAQSEWRSALAVIEVDDARSVAAGAAADSLVIFYTALYHSLLAPTRYDEAGGVYMGFDNQIHTLEEHGLKTGFYSDMSLWDTHRTQAPLLTDLLPSRQEDILRSLLSIGQQTHGPPRWPFVHVLTGGMFGNHGMAVFADALLKNVSMGASQDEQLYQLFRAQATGSPTAQTSLRTDIADWTDPKIGFVARDVDRAAACLTLAYAYDDHSMSVAAAVLGGHADDEAMFLERSRNWRNVLQTTWMIPRYRNGTWEQEFDKLNVFGDEYVEGDAWHYRWYVPHAMAELRSLWPSVKAYEQQLEEFCALSETMPSNLLPNAWYWAGNEPDILSLFAFLNTPKTQYWLRRITPERFTRTPAGIPGNDDYGTMSSWYLWYGLGIYPVTGTGQYAVGIPRFNSITVHRERGTWKVTCDCCNESQEEEVRKTPPHLSINGRLIETPLFSSDLLSSGSLPSDVVTMSWTCKRA